MYRRRRTGPVFMATTRNDKLMYVLLVGAIVLGLWTTLVSVGAGSEAHNYRETVSPWFRSRVPAATRRRGHGGGAAPVPPPCAGRDALFALWPFSRLVHAFTAPLHYLFRPYIVYRSRDRADTGSRPSRSGWSPVGTRDRDRGRR